MRNRTLIKLLDHKLLFVTNDCLGSWRSLKYAQNIMKPRVTVTKMIMAKIGILIELVYDNYMFWPFDWPTCHYSKAWPPFDGAPSMSMIISPQESLRESNFESKIQEISFACQDSFQPSHSFRPVHKLDFAHVISWSSQGCDWVTGGLI